jgi:hypothetical protein
MGILIASMLADSRRGDSQTPCFDRCFSHDAHLTPKKNAQKPAKTEYFRLKTNVFRQEKKP